MRPGMIVLADRNFAAAKLLAEIAGTGADLLIRPRTGGGCRCAAACRRLLISRIGTREVRVVRATSP